MPNDNTSGENPAQDQSSFAKRTARAGIMTYGQTFIQQIVRFVVWAILARLIGPEEFGAVAIAMLAVQFSEIFVSAAMTEAVVQREKLDKGHANAVLVTQLICGGLFALAMIGLAQPIAAAFDTPQVADLMPYLGIIVVLTGASSVPAALLMRELRYGILAVRSLAGLFIGAIVGLVMAYQGYGAWALVGQQLTAKTVDVLLLYSLGGWLPTFRFTRREFLDVIGAGGRMASLHALVMIEIIAPRAVIGIMGGGALAVSFFQLSWRLVETARSVLLAPLVGLWFPVISRLQAQPEKVAAATRGGLQATALAGVPAYAGLAAVAPVLIPFVFGDKWIPAIPTVKALCILGVFWSVAAANMSIVRGLGRPDFALKINAIRFVLSMVFLALFGRLGPTEAALALSLSLFLAWSLEIAAVRFLTPFNARDLVAMSAPALLGGAILFGVVSSLEHVLRPVGAPTIAVLAILITVGVLTYVAVVAVSAPNMRRGAISRMSALTRERPAGSP